MSDHDHKWEAVVVFPDQSPSFANGMEAGALWERMKTTPDSEFEQMICEGNEEVIRMLAAHYGWKVSTLERNRGWLTLAFEKARH